MFGLEHNERSILRLLFEEGVFSIMSGDKNYSDQPYQLKEIIGRDFDSLEVKQLREWIGCIIEGVGECAKEHLNEQESGEIASDLEHLQSHYDDLIHIIAYRSFVYGLRAGLTS